MGSTPIAGPRFPRTGYEPRGGLPVEERELRLFDAGRDRGAWREGARFSPQAVFRRSLLLARCFPYRFPLSSHKEMVFIIGEKRVDLVAKSRIA
jgi:hypothetical protein